jgi:L-2-hydroxyglutarate oxidase LhgO
MTTKSFLIIGAGIIGASIARALAMRGAKVTVLEKESELGAHASGRNSGVLHSGINQKPGTLKARMCVAGNRLAREFCQAHNVPMIQCGTIVVARTPKEEAVLKNVLAMGKEAGVEGLRIIDRDELEEREPAVIGTRALLSPSGAVVDSVAFLNAVVKEAAAAGAKFVLGANVNDIFGARVTTNIGEFHADHIINAAGLWADRIAHLMGVGKEYTIIPFRGEYMEVKNLDVRSMVYQVPDLRYPFLGVHFTRTVDGRVLAGPSATISFGRESYKKQIHVRDSLAMAATPNFWRLIASREFLKLAAHNAKLSLSSRAFLQEIRSLAPRLEKQDIVPFRSGIRAQMVDRRGKMVDDMLVEFAPTATHVLNAVSPGMTAALAFSEYVTDHIQSND